MEWFNTAERKCQMFYIISRLDSAKKQFSLIKFVPNFNLNINGQNWWTIKTCFTLGSRWWPDKNVLNMFNFFSLYVLN